jgi:hypothetical protein
VVRETGDLEFDYEAAARAILGFRFDAVSSVVLEVTGIHHQDERAVLGDALDSVFQDGGFVGPSDLSDAGQIDVQYGSRYYGATLDYRRDLGSVDGIEISVPMGAAAALIEEGFSLTNPGSGLPASVGRYDVDTSNRLFGVTLGADAVYRVPGINSLGLSLSGRFGIFGNYAQQDTRVIDDGAVVFEDTEDGLGVSTSIAGSAELIWQPTRNIEIAVGYEAMQVSGLALAPAQIAVSDAVGSYSRLRNDGSVLYHGVSARARYLVCGRFCVEPPRQRRPGGTWSSYASVESLFMARDVPNVLIATGPALLGTDDLNLGYRPAARVTAGMRRLGTSFEGAYGYFGSHQSNASLTAPGLVQPLFADGTFLTVEDFVDADTHQIDYDTNLHSIEISVRRHFGNWRGVNIGGIAGPRYLALDEGFTLTSYDSGGGVGRYRILADNEMFGGQLGVTFEKPMGPLSFAAQAKGGLYFNYAEQNTLVTNGGVLEISASQEVEHTSSVFEAGFSIGYNPNAHFGISAGYEAMHLGGVALAPAQMATINAAGAFSDINHSGSALYHGAKLKAILRF